MDPQVCVCGPRHYYDDGRVAFVSYIMLLISLFLIAGCLIGLTLGLTGVDCTWVKVMATTGNKKQRKQAKAVVGIKQRQSWFLCSMLLSSAFVLQSIPPLATSLFGAGIAPTLLIFAAVYLFIELLPMFLIPRSPLYWTYHLRYFIFLCMIATSLITYPLSWALDRCTIPTFAQGLYGNRQLGALIKYHERKEKNGGHLGADASRIMRGALELDGRTLEKSYSQRSLENGISKMDDTDDEIIDLEKSTQKENQCRNKCRIIVPWVKVKYLDSEEKVNDALLLKINRWAFSRLPVVGNAHGRSDSAIMGDAWNGKKVFGFLHTRALLGADIKAHARKGTRVKDLALYPLPIVRDDLSLYDLLNMFQSGIARIAIIIKAPVRDSTDWMPTNLATKTVTRPHHGTSSNPLWNHGLSRESQAEIGLKVDWMNDFIHAAKTGAFPDTSAPTNGHTMAVNTGIGCPEPLGIVTHEDIMNFIMQKESSDEKTFFDQNGQLQLQRIRPHQETQDTAGNVDTANSTLRKRTKSAQHFGMDGHQDDGYSRSEYTINSLGGFHGADESEAVQTKDIQNQTEAPVTHHPDACSHHGDTSCLLGLFNREIGSTESLAVSTDGQTKTDESHKEAIWCHTPGSQGQTGSPEGQIETIDGLSDHRQSPKVRTGNASAAIEESLRKARLASMHLGTGKALSPEREPGSPKRRSSPARFHGSGARISPTTSEETATTSTDNTVNGYALESDIESLSGLVLDSQHFQQHGTAFIKHQRRSRTLLPGQQMNILSSAEKAKQIQDEKEALASFAFKASTLADAKPRPKPKGKGVICPKESMNILGETEQNSLKNTVTRKLSPTTCRNGESSMPELTQKTESGQSTPIFLSLTPQKRVEVGSHRSRRSSASSMPELAQKTKSGKPAPIFLPPTPQKGLVEVCSSLSCGSSDSSMPELNQKTKTGKPAPIFLPPTPQTKDIEAESKAAKNGSEIPASRARNFTNSGLVAPKGEVRPRESSFHDDRSRLPSQRKVLTAVKAQVIGGESRVNRKGLVGERSASGRV